MSSPDCTRPSPGPSLAPKISIDKRPASHQHFSYCAFFSPPPLLSLTNCSSQCPSIHLPPTPCVLQAHPNPFRLRFYS
eukprot:763942-Hanusia_phi.AAC.5